MSTDKSEAPPGRTLLVQAATQAAHRLQISEQELETIIGGSDRNNDNRPLVGDQMSLKRRLSFSGYFTRLIRWLVVKQPRRSRG
jgi:hypothetical protein